MKGDKKNYSAKKKNYSPTNEVTHPTETPLCLWYDVFMPPPLLFGSKSGEKIGGTTKKLREKIITIKKKYHVPFT